MKKVTEKDCKIEMKSSSSWHEGEEKEENNKWERWVVVEQCRRRENSKKSDTRASTVAKEKNRKLRKKTVNNRKKCLQRLKEESTFNNWTMKTKLCQDKWNVLKVTCRKTFWNNQETTTRMREAAVESMEIKLFCLCQGAYVVWRLLQKFMKNKSELFREKKHSSTV